MNEQNSDTLKKALQQLPTYEAPADIWDKIQNDMAIYAKEASLREATAQLPVYKAPESIWKGIEQALQQPDPKQLRSLRIQRYSIAASIALLIAMGAYFLWPSDSPASIQMQYRKELVNMELLHNDWDEDQEDIEMIFRQFENSPVAKQEKHYETLLIEYAELNDAKNEVEEVMKNYGKDANLIRQMTKIELERTRIIKQMAILI